MSYLGAGLRYSAVPRLGTWRYPGHAACHVCPLSLSPSLSLSLHFCTSAGPCCTETTPPNAQRTSRGLHASPHARRRPSSPIYRRRSFVARRPHRDLNACHAINLRPSGTSPDIPQHACLAGRHHPCRSPSWLALVQGGAHGIDRSTPSSSIYFDQATLHQPQPGSPL